MGISRETWFRILLVIAGILIIISFMMPWWRGQFSPTTGIWIYGWGLRHNLGQFSSYVSQDLTPLYQTVVAWVYVAISFTALVFSLFLKRFASFLIQEIIGISHVFYTLVAIFVVIQNRIQDFDISLQGRTVLGTGLSIQCSIQPGFYLALAAGAFVVILAIIRFMLTRSHTN